MPTLAQILSDNNTVIRQQTVVNSIPPYKVADRLDAVAQFAAESAAQLPIIFIIGDGGTHTPAVGTDEYNNPDLANFTGGLLFRNSQIVLSGISFLSAGGFKLTAPGDVFSNNEEWVWLVNGSVTGTQLPPGDPAITIGSDFTVTKNNCKDKSGNVSVKNDSSSGTNGTNISIAFEYPRQDISSIQITKFFSGDDIQFEVYNVSSTALTIRIIGDIAIGSTSSFYYTIT